LGILHFLEDYGKASSRDARLFVLLFTYTVFAMGHKISCDPLQAAWAAIQVYLELDRAPASAANAANAQSAADAKLSPEELKKLKQKRRKVRSHICPDGHR
jgi:hypothetical protein